MILLQENNPNILRAAQIASLLHDGIVYSGQPYTYHLERVYNTLKRFGHRDEIILMSAWLHDAVEDTDCDIEFISTGFGPEVAKLVSLVTDDPQYTDRATRKLRSYPRIASDKRAVILKTADRIANVEVSLEEGSYHYFKYQNEHPLFKKHLYPECCDRRMWAYLELLLTDGNAYDNMAL